MLKAKVLADRYEVIEPVARGGMAEVFRARDDLLNRTVALKVLHPEFSTDKSFVERFRREAQAAANLSHPNIVNVYDWGEETSVYYMVMEYVDGKPLRSVLRQEGRLPPNQTVKIAAEVASALHFAHRHGVVHRDIKPGNILIDSAGDVKVTDFGIARAVGASEQLTQAGTVIGTAHYLSPEQAQGLAVDAKSDVYSLGVVIYEMLTGQVPFTGDNPLAIAFKHVNEAPPSPRSIEPEIPKDLEAIVLKTLAKNPATRYASAEDLRQDLIRFSRGEAVEAAPTLSELDVIESDQITATEVIERKPPMWPFVVVLLLLLGLLATGLYLLGKNLGVFGAPADVNVPEVVGRTYDPGAKQELERMGLRPVPIFRQSTSAETGKVLSQDPLPGVILRVNSQVTVVVGIGPGTAKTPRVTGLQKDDATRVITEAGFRVGSIKEEFSDSHAAGVVLDQDPQPDKEVSKESAINLVVSKGKEPVTVPDVVGRDQNEAIRLIQNAGLQVGQISRQQNDAPAGQVISQSPKAGGEIEKGSVVNFTISEGPATIEVPNLIGQRRNAAAAALASLGLKTNTVTCTPADQTTAEKVVAQQPSAGSQVEKGATIRITVADPASGGATCPS